MGINSVVYAMAKPIVHSLGLFSIFIYKKKMFNSFREWVILVSVPLNKERNKMNDQLPACIK